MKKRLSLALAVALGASVLAVMPVTAHATSSSRPTVVSGRGTAVPAFVSGIQEQARQGSPAVAARAHLAAHTERYRIGKPERSLRTLDIARSPSGTTTVRLGQIHRGVPVFGAQYLVHMKKRDGGYATTSANGHFFSRLSTPVEARVPASAADRIALRSVAPLEHARLVRHGRTVLAEGPGILTHHVTVWGSRFGKPVKQEVFVNARTGAIALSYNNLQTDTVDARNAHGGTVPLRVQSQGGGSYKFIDSSRTFPGAPTGDIITCNAHATPDNSCAAANAITASGPPIAGVARRVGGVDAHWGAGKVFQYYKAMGRNSIDDAGMDIISAVNVSNSDGSPMYNAFWNGSQMSYGYPNDGQVYPLSADLDVVGHELTHGVTQFTGGLVYINESGAMNEAYSDYFGNAIDNNVQGTGMNSRSAGYIGEDLCIVPNPANWQCPLRNMNDGRTTSDYTFYLADIDNGGVHLNSTIYSGALWNVRELFWNKDTGGRQTGADRADGFVYQALASYITPLDSFYDGRLATIQAARDNGATPRELDLIRRGFDRKSINATWDTGASNDSKIVRKNVAPLGFFFSPVQASRGRYIVGDYIPKTGLCCEAEQIYVGQADGSGGVSKVGEDDDPTTFNDELPDIGNRLAVWSHLSTDGLFNVHGRTLGSPAVKNISTPNPNAWNWFPSTSGRLTAWEHLNLNTGATDIYARRSGSATVRKVVTASGDQYLPQVAGDWVAYWNVAGARPKVQAKNLQTGRKITFKGGPKAFLGPPGTGGGRVYWYQDGQFFGSLSNSENGYGGIKRSVLGKHQARTVVSEYRHRRAPVWIGVTSPPRPSANRNWVTYSSELGYALQGAIPSHQVGRDVWIARAERNATPHLVTHNRADQAYSVMASRKGKRVLWFDSVKARTDLMTQR